MLDIPSCEHYNPVNEHLSPACIQAVASRHVTGASEPGASGQRAVGEQLQSQGAWSNFSTLSTTTEPKNFPSRPTGRALASPNQRRQAPAVASRGRYSGNIQVPIPEELVMDEDQDQTGLGQNLGAAAAPAAAATADNPERQAQRDMMDTAVITLRHICPELTRIYHHLSVFDAWEDLAAELGLSTSEVHMFKSLLQTRPGIPPGQTFLETYMGRHDLSMRALLRALLSMQATYHNLAQELWTAALLNNSPYYLALRDNRFV